MVAGAVLSVIGDGLSVATVFLIEWVLTEFRPASALTFRQTRRTLSGSCGVPAVDAKTKIRGSTRRQAHPPRNQHGSGELGHDEHSVGAGGLGPALDNEFALDPDQTFRE